MSTNDVAIRKIRSGIEQGIIITNDQKKGRGRFGNKWISLKGNLFTTIFYKVNSNYNLKKITQKNCLLIFKTLKTVIKKKISIKYPNDIYVEDRKIAGVLCEQIVTDKITAPIIGIGINVNSNLDDLKLVKDKPYTSLFVELGQKTNRENLLKDIVEKIDDIIQKQEYQ